MHVTITSFFYFHGSYISFIMQLPRLYNVYKNMGIVTSFQNILDNVFIPLFEVTVDPNSHPHLHMFLMQVSWLITIVFICLHYYFLIDDMTCYSFWFRARKHTLSDTNTYSSVYAYTKRHVLQ